MTSTYPPNGLLNWGDDLQAYVDAGTPHAYVLSAAATAGATTVSVHRAPDVFAGGSYVAVGALTTKCEIRRVTATASLTVTLDRALVYDHAADENVWVLNSTWVSPEWFGCKANDATFDSHTGLMQAYIEAALGANHFGLTGHNQRYYTTRPLCFFDGSLIDNITHTRKTPWAVNPMIGLRDGVPDQFMAMPAGQFGTVSSVNTGTNVVTTSTSAGSAAGDKIAFYPAQGATMPTGLETGRMYYLKTAAGNDYTISVDVAGTTFDFTDTGSGTIYWFSLGTTRVKWNGVTFEGGGEQGLNGIHMLLQQPSRTVALRTEGFPGPHGGLCLGGQQSEHFSTMIVDGSVGLNLQGGQFHYFYGFNAEDCDILVRSDNIDYHGGAGFGRDVHIWGGHYESPGIHTSRTQTIIGAAAVSAGTFTLSFGGQTTTGIAHDASAATIQTALEALSTLAPGDVTVTQEVGLLTDGGRMRCDFAGVYAWKALTGNLRMTVDSTGLTGGSYSMNYAYPSGCAIQIQGPQAMLGAHGGVFAANGTKPDGTGFDFLVNDGTVFDGYIVEHVVSMGQGGNAIKDNARLITVPWADSTGTSERLAYFSAGGKHGGTSAKNWYLAGRLGGHLAWDEHNEELRVMSTAKLRFGDTGPLMLSGTGSPESAVTAPVGSLYLRSDGGTNTTIYRKESGAGNTGWVAVSNAGGGGGGGYPAKYKTGKYYVAPQGRGSGADSGVAQTLDRVIYVPFPVGEALTADRIACSVTANGTAGAVVRLGIYGDTDGQPDALIVDAGTVDSTTNGYKEITINQALTSGGLYWLAIAAQVATCSLRSAGIGDGSDFVGNVLTGDSRAANWIQTGVTGAFPGNATPADGVTQSPIVKLRAA